MILDDAVASLSSTGSKFSRSALEWALGHKNQAGSRFAAMLSLTV